MQTNGEIIERVRKIKGITQQAISEEIKPKMSVPTIYRITRGDKRASEENVARLAKYLGCIYDWAKHRVIPPADIPAAAFGNGDETSPYISPNARPVLAKIRRVPVFRLLSAARLGGPEDMYTVTQEPDEYRDTPAPSDECMVVQLDGDCMEPDWPAGCYAMIDVGRTFGEGLIPGAAYYVQLRGDMLGKATFKRYVGPDGDAEVFDCINSKKYPDKIKLAGLFNAGIAVAKVTWMAGKKR